MAGTADDQHREHVTQQTERLRRQAACLSATIAETEGEVAVTFEQLAKTRPADARRVAQADQARRHAVEERNRAAGYSGLAV